MERRSTMARQPLSSLGTTFAVLLVVAMLGFSAVGLWLHRQMQHSLERETGNRLQAESLLLTQRIQSLHAQPTGIASSAVLRGTFRPGLRSAVALYDANGRRFAFSASDGFTGDHPFFPERLPPTEIKNVLNAGDDRQFRASFPIPSPDGPVFARTLVSDEKTRLSTSIARIVYEIPVWIVGSLGLILIGRMFFSGFSAPRNEPTGGGERNELQFVMESYQQVIDRLQSTGRELVHLRNVERIRAESSERFSDRLVAGIPDALIVVSSDRTVSIVNAQARRLFEQDAGSEFSIFFVAAPPIVEAVEAVLNNGDTRWVPEFSMVLGKRRRVLDASVSAIPGSAAGAEGVLCLVTDMTELSDLRATMRTKETLSNLGEMAAGIAHEFKNSLATIGGYARLLEKSATDPKPAQSLRTEVSHLTQVVTDFLAFARPQTISHSPCDLGEIIGDCIQSLSERARRNNVEILPGRELPVVSGDPVLLRTAFGNLILNAVEAISESRLNRTVTIFSNIDIEPGMAQISISDSGDGIPDEVRPNVFIPFFSTKSRGYGMGLAIVQKVVVSHNGRIEVQSQIGQGTTFSCVLPLWGTFKPPVL